MSKSDGPLLLQSRGAVLGKETDRRIRAGEWRII